MKVGNIGLLEIFYVYFENTNSEVSERYFTAKFTVVKYQFSQAIKIIQVHESIYFYTYTIYET